MLALNVFACAVLLGTAPAQDERTVTKASVYLVKSPSFLAPRAANVTLHRGDKVKLAGERQGAWFPVTFKPKKGKQISGFIHLSYLSDRPAAFKVDQQEVEGKGLVSGHYNLAVPGLREDIALERQQKNKDAAQGYAVVNRYLPLEAKVAALAVPRDPSRLARFLAEGRLREPAEISLQSAVGGQQSGGNP